MPASYTTKKKKKKEGRNGKKNFLGAVFSFSFSEGKREEKEKEEGGRREREVQKTRKFSTRVDLAWNRGREKKGEGSGRFLLPAREKKEKKKGRREGVELQPRSIFPSLFGGEKKRGGGGGKLVRAVPFLLVRVALGGKEERRKEAGDPPLRCGF